MRFLRPEFALLFIALTFCGCGSSTNAAGTGRTDEMNRVLAEFANLQKSLNAGLSKQEYAAKVHDALKRIGDLDSSEKLAEVGLPADKVAFVYSYFNHAAIAYAMSAQFVGNEWSDGSQTDTDSTSATERASVGGAFPDLYPADLMSRRQIVQDLLIVAQDQADDAAGMIKTL